MVACSEVVPEAMLLGWLKLVQATDPKGTPLALILAYFFTLLSTRRQVNILETVIRPVSLAEDGMHMQPSPGINVCGIRNSAPLRNQDTGQRGREASTVRSWE
jgi:hypothetical protein